jgi:hypothetical protein
MAAYSDLTGRWMGRYDYAATRAPVPFEVDLTETAGSLHGKIHEPNTIANAMGAALDAILDGSRDGAAVRFVKVYRRFDQGDDPVYEGTVNATMTRVAGAWWFPLTPAWRGRFLMVRPVQAAATREVAAVADEE